MKDNDTKARFIELQRQGIPLKSIADEIGVNKTTLVNWEQALKEQVDNLRAMALEAMYDKYYRSIRKKVEFFSDVLSRTRGELETQDLSTVLTDKLFAMYAHIYREA
jgi:transcriptional regulator with XRE-family HTH domain